MESPSDGELWGFDLGNGTFTGVAGDIQFNRKDIGWAGLYLRSIHLDMVDFTYPHDYDTFCFLVIRNCIYLHIYRLQLKMSCYFFDNFEAEISLTKAHLL